MRSDLLIRLPLGLISVVIFFGCGPTESDRVITHFFIPHESDPRFTSLMIKVKPLVVEDQILSDVIEQAQVATLLKSPIVFRGGVDATKISLKFDGGTLMALLDQVCEEAKIEIKFENFSTSFNPSE